MAEDLFDETPEERADADTDRSDLEIKQRQEESADDKIEILKLSITPQKLKDSRPHEFLMRDALLSQLSSPLDIEIGVSYHALCCDLEWAGLTESAQTFNSEHTSWLDHTVGINGFGRRELSTTNINRKSESIKPAVPKPNMQM